MRSWVPGADASDFGLDNLPLGIFSTPLRTPRPGVAIGDSVADLTALVHAGIIEEPSLGGTQTLNGFLARGRTQWQALRGRLQRLFGPDVAPRERVLAEAALVPRDSVTMHLPIDVQDYVDFYSSIEHATNVGKLFRPENPLLPNYRHMPIGYHGRAGTVVIDGTPIRRPYGQTRASDAPVPTFARSEMLDFELEMAFVTGPGNRMGEPIPIDRAREHIYGYVLLDDWSARDIQAWEYQPLGPFLGKSFATSISPWLVSLDALEPFRVENRALDPEPLLYLRTRERWAYDIELEVLVESAKMRAAGAAPAPVARTNFRNMYWHAAQQLAHMTSNGTRVRAGDLYASGTISGTEPGSFGSLIELTALGTQPIALPGGERRRFLEDGDAVIVRGRAARGDHRIGFGEVRGMIVP